MNPFKLIGLTALLGLSLGLGYGLYERNKTASPAIASTEKPGLIDHLPAFTYPDLQGNLRSSDEWSDKIVILNFWASWCPPCKKEIPDFISVQKKYPHQVQFVGIAIDDKQPIEQFANEHGINYPTLLGDINAIELSRQLGNRFSGLPFTAIFDRNGQLHHHKTGELPISELESQIKALL